jgi:ABC-type multidrug transport system fused ATPase/permease subunit
LTQRIRTKAFACLLRQEVAYFDQPENSSGAICARLSTDALAVQEITGTRLGIIFESLSLSCFGLVLGFLFSWQLTIIIVIAVLLFIIITSINIRLEVWYNRQSSASITRASTVRLNCYLSSFYMWKNSTIKPFLSFLFQLVVEVIHNMRTIKQLSVEKEVLQQYFQLIHQQFMLVV